MPWMIIAPIIFCTIVLGVGSVAKAATVGKVGGLAMIYFLCMATLALIIGLVWVAVLTLAWFVTGTRTSAAAHNRTGTLPVVRTRQSHED